MFPILRVRAQHLEFLFLEGALAGVTEIFSLWALVQAGEEWAGEDSRHSHHLKHSMKLAFLLVAALLCGCSPAKPQVLCTMQNPATGRRVELFKELRFKVPAGYDERRHIEEWKAEQRAKGYSVEVAK